MSAPTDLPFLTGWAADPDVGAWTDPVDVGAAARLREALRASEFTSTRLHDVLGPQWGKAYAAVDLAVGAQDLPDDAFGVAAFLFVLGYARKVDQVASVGLAPDDLVALGLAEVRDGWVVPAMRVEPWRGFFVIADPAKENRFDANFVLGTSLSGERCADLTVRLPAERGLDLGTGCGLQALALSVHTREIVATDINERALWVAVRNAALNDVQNIELRQGSFFEPVAGEQFDVITCNAPFVVSGSPKHLYLNAGLQGDDVSQHIMRNLGAHVGDGGWATSLVSWIVEDVDQPVARPRAWVERNGCASLLLTLRNLGLADHARAWASLPAGFDEVREVLAEWQASLRALGATRVHEGAVVLRRRKGARTWVRHDSFTPDLPRQAGAHVRRIFAGLDAVEGLVPGQEAIDLALVPASTLRLAEELEIEDAETRITRVELRLVDGIAPIGEIEPVMAGALPRMAEAASARVAVRESALSLDAPLSDLPRIEAQATLVVEELLRTGVLVVRPEAPLSPCPVVTDASLLGEVRRRLDRIGFDEAGVRAMLDLTEAGPLEVGDPVTARIRTDLDEPLGVVIWLLVLEQPLPEEVVDEVLGEETVALLREAGLVEVREDRVWGRVRLVPYQHLLIASDSSDESSDARVPGAHGSASVLDRLTPRRAVGRCLDLGTGNGIQALLAARHATVVVGTDVNPRALDFARANAALNGIENIEWRLGSWFEPVTGEQFDLVVANPPYVISPEARFTYRDGGGLRDEVSELVVRAVPAVLAPGATAVVMLGWVHDRNGLPAPQRWVEGSGCDAVLLSHDVQPSLLSAVRWNLPLQDDRGAYEERIDAWGEYFAEAGIDLVGYGTIAMRRRAGAAGPCRSLAIKVENLGPAGAHVERLLAAAPLLEEPDDVAMGWTLALARAVSVEQTLVPGEGALVPGPARLRLGDGVGLEMRLDASGVALLGAFASPTTVRDALASVARTMDQPVAVLAESALGFARSLVGVGVLEHPG